MSSKRVYFPNLNGLRFIAALLVIIHHIEQMKHMYGMESFWETVPFVKVIGKLGVVLFFVLSGFLITYLLLSEEKLIHTIEVRKFYVRRILRIWPLYFLIVILALFVLPHLDTFTWPGYGKELIYSDFIPKLLLYLLFLPNLVLTMFGIVPYAAQAWSIGTEEQFYLLWPLLFKYVKKYRMAALIAVVIIYVFIGQVVLTQIIPEARVFRGFWGTFNIDCMAIGGIYAMLLFNKSRWLKFLFSPYLFYTTTLLLGILLARGVHVPYIHYEFYSVLFGVIILNLAANEKLKYTLENKLLNYMGGISYGMYMFHLIGVVLALRICMFLGAVNNWILYPLSVLLTVLLAGASYKYFEAYFLKFKPRFTNFISGNRIGKEGSAAPSEAGSPLPEAIPASVEKPLL